MYYLKKGVDKIQEDLFGMAVSATQHEAGTYLIIDDLEDLRPILQNYHNAEELKRQLRIVLDKMQNKFLLKFKSRYGGSWETFAEKRSTIIFNDKVIKYAGRMRRNFTDPSQRAGHIAVGEMYLTKYLFYGKRVVYLMPKMTRRDIEYLDVHKSDDKEWYLLRHEPMVELKTMDDIIGLSPRIKSDLLNIQNEPLKGEALYVYRACIDYIDKGIRDKSLIIK